MSLQALILTRDQEALRVLRRVLEEVGIHPHVSAAAGDAQHTLAHNKFDAVFVDCDDVRGGAEVLQTLRQGGSSRGAIGFAILNGVTTLKMAYDLGANFVLDKPIKVERASRGIRAAHGLILRERCRYIRIPLDITAQLSTGYNLPEVQVRALNISEGGIAVRAPRECDISGQVKFRFTLPGSKIAIEGGGSVVWTTKTSEFGIRFDTLAHSSRTEIERWLNLQIESGMPVLSNGAKRR